MDEQTTGPNVLGRYTLVLIGTIVALIVANAVLVATLGVPIPSGAATIVPPMVAALVAGQTWAKATGAVPENRPAWRFAVVGGLIFLAVQVPLTILGLAAAGPMTQGLMILTIGLMVVTTAIVVLTNRWFVSVGAKGVLKQR